MVLSEAKISGTYQELVGRKHAFLLVEGTSSNATLKVYETGSTEVTATRKNNYYFGDWDPDTTSCSAPT